MPNQYTHIVLGSSPLCLTEAICLQLSGKKVLLIESEHAMGGSWKTIQTKKFKDVETGCHVMYRNRAAYQFMEEKLGIKMPDFSPQPLIIRHHQKANYKYTNFWDVIDVGLSVHLKKREIKTVLAYIKRAVIELADKGKFRYPDGGSKVMLEKLMRKAQETGVIFKTLQVDEIYIKNQSIELMDGSEKITADHLIITPNTTLKQIKSDDQYFNISVAEKRSVANLFLLIEGSAIQTMSYVGVKKHKIFRIADMTYHNKHYLDKGQRVVCAQIRQEYLQTESDAEKVKDEVVSFLKKFNLVSSNMVLKDWELYYYDYYHRHEHFLKELPNQFMKQVQILRSHNFIISMSEIAERWKHHLPSVK